MWPEPDSSAAGHRMMQLISLLQTEGWNITFASPAAETGYMADLEKRGVKRKRISVNNSEFDRFLKNVNPSVVLFDRFIMEEQFGWRVARQCPGALRILDTEDLHCLRRTRQKAVKNENVFSSRDLLDEEISLREVASIYRSDLSLIISEAEIQLLREVFGVEDFLLQYLPFMFEPVDKDSANYLSFEERRHFVTIGNFRHAPNLDAVKFLKNRIWTSIHEQLPEA